MVIRELVIGPKRFKLDRTLIMGVLNVTPDSFSDGGHYLRLEKALERARQMVEEGCDILDVGGESTRPFSSPISADEELERVAPVLELVRDLKIPVSIDTYKPEVARKALEMGVHMVNDISGLRDEEMVSLVAKWNVPVIIMHMKGEPKNMQENPEYDDVVSEIKDFFKERFENARQHGIDSGSIIIDPGIGFGKSTEHNLEILKRLNEFKDLGFPVLVGTSRKSFIGKILGSDEEDRLEGSLATMTTAILNGADIVRVHDVKESVRAAKLADVLRTLKR